MAPLSRQRASGSMFFQKFKEQKNFFFSKKIAKKYALSYFTFCLSGAAESLDLQRRSLDSGSFSQALRLSDSRSQIIQDSQYSTQNYIKTGKKNQLASLAHSHHALRAPIYVIVALRAQWRLAFWCKLPTLSRTISELLLLKKWLNSFLFEIKRVIHLLKALSPLRNTFSSRYSRSILRLHFYNSLNRKPQLFIFNNVF